jgi:hypothetical protein
MADTDTRRLADCIARYQHTIPELTTLSGAPPSGSLDSLIEVYERCYPLLERALWSGVCDFEALLDCYQGLFREQDVLIRQKARLEGTSDPRHRFILSIPVADRPAHLRACLESIYQLCERFAYGGNTGGVYERIQIVVAEDSRRPSSIRQHIDLVEQYRRKGLRVTHFGQDEQYALLQSIPEQQRQRLGHILSTQAKHSFYLKGQAANRNLSYLKCLQLTQDRQRTLYYFVDSDESLCVNRQTATGDEAVYALNYFHYIDKAFAGTDTELLTGKMVGDPPVSPAVMAANFLDDVSAFFTTLAEATPEQACRFHGPPQRCEGSQAAGAIYHDMAGLFGFANQGGSFPYRCPLPADHDHAACLSEFSRRLAAFFFGEHLFRNTYFDYQEGFRQLTPARTVYPGNYIANYAGLKYVIPFGHLRLRMSGPTAGRLIGAEIRDRFASINLPHLHRRTTEDGLDQAFRPGVELSNNDTQAHTDLSNEFERQFFGDLMLFSTEALLTRADVKQPFTRDSVMEAVQTTEQKLLTLYQHKHDAILENNRRLRGLVFDAGHWWLDAPGLSGALGQISAFIESIQHNFGEQSRAWRQIQSAEHRAERKQQIVAALLDYRDERDAWERLFP